MKLTTRVKINKLKNNLVEQMCRPFCMLNRQHEKIKDLKYEKFRQKSIAMSMNEVAERTAKIIIKDLIKHNFVKQYNIELQVASWCDTNYCEETILQYQRRQRKDIKLSTYAYNIEQDCLDYNKKMQVLLCKLLVQAGCCVEYKVREHFQYKSKHYEKSIIISIR